MKTQQHALENQIHIVGYLYVISHTESGEPPSVPEMSEEMSYLV